MSTHNTPAPWIVGSVATPKGDVPVISTKLCGKDRLGTLKVRFDIGRDNYRITPGLYAVGQPDSSSPVLVSANYKLTFDSLRRELTGLDLWLLILDTDGVNVWCSAGKGTFGTAEVIKRVALTGLPAISESKTLILPQLAASGVNAFEVQKRTGFQVVYGPVRAADIPAFLSSGMETTAEMRTVRFNTWDRLVLTPVELVLALRHSVPVLAVLFLLNLFAARPFALPDLLIYCAAVLSGTVLTPVLLPVLPGRAFALKGWLLSLLVTASICWGFGWFTQPSWMLSAGYLLALPAYSAYLAMNFTGASTYTSHTGVIKEIRAALPWIASSLVSGCILLLVKALMG